MVRTASARLQWLSLWAAALAPAVGQVADAADGALRRNVAWQIALENVGLSPGLIDGRIGPKTELATREFQRVRGLRKTGQPERRDMG